MDFGRILEFRRSRLFIFADIPDLPFIAADSRDDVVRHIVPDPAVFGLVVEDIHVTLVHIDAGVTETGLVFHPGPFVRAGVKYAGVKAAVCIYPVVLILAWQPLSADPQL